METLTLTPDESSFSVKDSTALLYQALDGGRGRQRADVLDGTRIVPVQWTLNRANYDLLRTFYGDYIGRNSESFNVSIYSASGVLTSYEATFVAETFKLVGNDGNTFVVGASLEIVPNDDEDDSWPGAPVCYIEQFKSGLQGYVVTSGASNLFAQVNTPFGLGISLAAQNSGVEAIITHALDDPILADSIHAKFIVTSFSSDDAGELSLQIGPTNLVVFNPRREASFDSLRRALLTFDGEAIFVTDASIAVNVWHQLEIDIVPGAGNTISTITRLDTNAIVKTQALANNHSQLTFDALTFLIDSGGTTSPTQFVDVEVCHIE